MNKKVLIYGGSGGVGSVLARKLASHGIGVHIAGRNEETLSSLATELGCGYTVGDVSDESFFQQPQLTQVKMYHQLFMQLVPLISKVFPA